MQKATTLQFWDDIYASNQDDVKEKEWIAQPNKAFFDKIWRAVASNKKDEEGSLPRRILEIGCGTSTLSRDLYIYLQNNYPSVTFHVMATDVSDVCIQKVRQRDETCFVENSDAKESKGLEYRVWNVTTPPPPSFLNYFHVVLDKGCLDTLFFRSRNRGPRRFTLMHKVLQHVAACLQPPNGTDDAVASRYLCISPRRKIKVLRDKTLLLHYDQKPEAIPRENGDLEGDAERTVYYLHLCSRHTPPSTEDTSNDT